MTDILAQVKEAAYRTKLKWPGNSDLAKANRAAEAYKWFVELKRHYGRNSALLILDPNKNTKKGFPKDKPTMFGVSDRSIRRIETIREQRAAVGLEDIVMKDGVSLETASHSIIRKVTVDIIEAMWLAASDETRTEFLRRIGK